MFQTLSKDIDFVADTPIHSLNLSASLQVNDAVGEQVEHFITDLLCIVPVLKYVPRRQIIPDLIEVLHQLVGILVGFVFLWHLW